MNKDCGQVNRWTRGAHNAETRGSTPRPAILVFKNGSTIIVLPGKGDKIR